MKYIETKFTITAKDGSEIKDDALLQTAKDLLCGCAGECGFESFQEDGNIVYGYVQETVFDKETLDANVSCFPIDGIKITYSTQEAEYKNWNEAWENAGFEPITIPGKCVIHDTINRPAAIDNGMLDITIDAKQAFGTGNHETTFMIINELFDMEIEAKSVLDCGCGTGILSIVASKLNAEKVTAYDIDEWSVKNTMHNCEVNDAGNVNVIHGDASVLRSINTKFDVVMANINRNILLADMPSFKKVMDKNAVLIISGFYMQDVEYLKDKAAELNLRFVKRETMNDWCMLKFINTDD